MLDKLAIRFGNVTLYRFQSLPCGSDAHMLDFVLKRTCTNSLRMESAPLNMEGHVTGLGEMAENERLVFDNIGSKDYTEQHKMFSDCYYPVQRIDSPPQRTNARQYSNYVKNRVARAKQEGRVFDVRALPSKNGDLFEIHRNGSKQHPFLPASTDEPSRDEFDAPPTFQEMELRANPYIEMKP
jgi:hypothetical protein